LFLVQLAALFLLVFSIARPISEWGGGV